MTTQDRNPFYGRPGSMLPQTQGTCDLCQGGYLKALGSSCFIIYADQGKLAGSVCPECMHRMGFRPMRVLPLASYARMVDTISLYSIERQTDRSADGEHS